MRSRISSVNYLAFPLITIWARHRDYSLNLDFGPFIEYFVRSSILSQENDSLSFCYPYLYYYSVGRYMRDHISEEEVRNHVRSICTHLYQKEAANILLFLCYLSKDPFILSTVLEASRTLFAAHPECDLIEGTTFLNDLIGDLPHLMLDNTPPDENHRKALEQKDDSETQNGNENWDDIEWETAPSHDQEIQQWLQINAAVKTVQIMGQILRNHEGSLNREQKLELAQECYSLGLRVLHFMVQQLGVSREDLTKAFVDFVRSKRPDIPEDRLVRAITDLWILCVEATCILLVRHISGSVGIETLAPTFDAVLEHYPTVSYRFIDLSIRADHSRWTPSSRHNLVKNKVELSPRGLG